MEQGEDRIEELEHFDKDKGKNYKMVWTVQERPLSHHWNTKPMNHGHRRRRDGR
jgi:hypothetical protein